VALKLKQLLEVEEDVKNENVEFEALLDTSPNMSSAVNGVRQQPPW
jgi:hypothetical protein